MKTVLLSTCLFLYAVAPAQDSVHVSRPAFLSCLTTYDFPRSYGLLMMASVPFHSRIKQDASNSSHMKKSENDEIIFAEIGAQRRPFVYTAAFAKAGIGFRFIKSVNHFTELDFEQGIMRTIYDGEVYQLEPDGTLKQRALFGRTYATSGFSYSQNWSIDTRNAWFVQLQPSMWIQYPYDCFLKLHLSLQVGISYHIKDVFIHARTKYPHRS